MLNRKSRSRSQSLLPLPDLSRKIEGDSARRVLDCRLRPKFRFSHFPTDYKQSLHEVFVMYRIIKVKVGPSYQPKPKAEAANPY